MSPESKLNPKSKLNPESKLSSDSKPNLVSRRAVPVLAATLLSLALIVPSAHAEDGFIRDKKGCKVSNPNPKPEESVEWSGKCVEGYADGKGLLQWYVNGAASTRYEGTVQHGQLSGRGKLTMPDGATYDGQWLAGKQDGKGVQSMPDGTRYEGEWKNGQPNGHGVLRDAKGKTVEGEWKNGAYLSQDKDNDDDQ